MLIIGAMMRKLLHVAYDLLKSGQPSLPPFTVVDMDNSIYACLPGGMSSAAELGEAGEEDRAEGQGEAKQDLHD